jgi:hypothetical protein
MLEVDQGNWSPTVTSDKINYEFSFFGHIAVGLSRFSGDGFALVVDHRLIWGRPISPIPPAFWLRLHDIFNPTTRFFMSSSKQAFHMQREFLS